MGWGVGGSGGGGGGGGGEKKQVSPGSHPRQRPHIDAVFGRAPTHVVKDEGHRGVVGDQVVGTHEGNNCRCAAEANQGDEQCDRHADGDGLPGVLRLFPWTIVDFVSSIYLPKLLWVCCPGHAGVKREDRVGTLAGKETLTTGLLFSRKV